MIYGARFMRVRINQPFKYTPESAHRTPLETTKNKRVCSQPPFHTLSHPWWCKTRVCQSARCESCRRSPEFGCAAVRENHRVDPTCASEKLPANRLISRRLDLELMQGRVSRESQKSWCASVCISHAYTHS